jgi:hypothetical protein
LAEYPPPNRTLIKHWDGHSWTRVPSPNGHQSENELLQVSAASAHDIWAVGWTGDLYTGIYLPLVVHFDGTRWTRVPFPKPPPCCDYRFWNASVSAESATSVWIYGTSEDANGVISVLTAHWDGTQWSVMLVPNRQGFSATGGTAISSSDAWAVGWFGAQRGRRGFALHWDGASWSKVAIPDPGSGAETLSGVSAISTDNVWAIGHTGVDTIGAIGYHEVASEPEHTLALHWNGTSWAVIPTPTVGYGAELAGFSAVSPTDAWAVGEFNTTKRRPLQYHTLIMHWNGHRWFWTASPPRA